MTSKRKTVEVAYVLQVVNALNRLTADEMTAERHAANSVLEQVLMHTGNYKGFAYVTRTTDTEDSRHVEPGMVQAGQYDDSRRRYYV